MPFEWNIEDNVLNMEWNEHKRVSYYDDKFTFRAESEVSKKDKIEFIDSLTDGALSYILNLEKKFCAERESLPKNKLGYVKTNSLQAWLKRNDIKQYTLFNITRMIGEISIKNRGNKYNLYFPPRNIEKLNTRNRQDIYDDYTDETFHRILHTLAEYERIYAEEHDEYKILERKAREYVNCFGGFGAKILDCGKNGLVVLSEDNTDNSRKLSVDELKAIVEKGEKVQHYIDILCKDPIKYKDI